MIVIDTELPALQEVIVAMELANIIQNEPGRPVVTVYKDVYAIEGRRLWTSDGSV